MSAQPARSTTKPMTIRAIGEAIRMLRKQNDTGGKAGGFPAEAWDATEQAIKNLTDLALAMPPKTLADVAVQAELAHSISKGMADCDTIPAAARAEIHRLRHVLAGAAVLLGRGCRCTCRQPITRQLGLAVCDGTSLKQILEGSWRGNC